MMVLVGAAGWIPAPQEFFFLLFFRPLGAALRVVLPHVFLFLWGQLGQMAYEEDQLPAVLVVSVGLAPSRHPTEAYAVVDDVVDLSISQGLCRRQAHVGCFGVKIPTHGRDAAAVISMADGAVVGKVAPRLGQDLLGDGVWVPL